MTLTIPFDNSFARLSPQFYSAQQPTPVSAPQMIAFNEDLAKILGVTPGDSAQMAQVFAGNQIPEGAQPISQVYSGHQFGNYNPQLGDGRAILLGETVGTDGKRRDIQLKGAGRTPYSRGGDGRAWLGPVLREYIVSEAMHALGIPTTRALAATRTGDPVYRQAALPGAVLTRTAASHLRVGSFQYFAAKGDTRSLIQLTNYAIQRHYPDADGPMALLRAVRDAQAELIAKWMSVGFIHGVMNTDNCAISGETIDYGPCAFLDSYHPDTVFSSIDQMGRYAYSNQPHIVVWNLAQLATALIRQIADTQAAAEEATEIVHAMPALIQTHWLTALRAKIGLPDAQDRDETLITDLLDRMAQNQADFTNTFRSLGTDTARDQFTDPGAYDQWHSTWTDRLNGCDPRSKITQTNPAIIPRNHRIEQLISDALQDDYTAFHRLNTALKTPFNLAPENTDLANPPTPDEVVPATFCGT